ncbi:MAG: divalent-cation tolerance protein CutA [Methylotenera sp.]|nr:divalent-cation tolerance protein CutA [Methylotenera sp.]
MLIEVSTTCGTREEAKKIAKLAITEKLCACVHIDEIESFYSWQDVVHNEIEYKLTFKTVESRYEDILRLVTKEHSYDLPAIYSTPVLKASKSYEEWITENSTI